MADKHPYVNGTGGLIQVLDHLKKSFPATLSAEVLKKLGFAPKNESYIINTVRFLKLIDDKGARTDIAHKTFTLHDTVAFEKAFSEIVKAAYADLFSLHSDGAWSLDSNRLITFFRQTDQSSQLVGKLQASTFTALATYAGHREAVTAAKPKQANRVEKAASTKPLKRTALRATQKSPESSTPRIDIGSGTSPTNDTNFGLTVRIEINLPASGDQETYDRIFKSIRENLLNG